MEFQKIVNFLGTTSDNKDLPKVYDQSEKNYNSHKENINVKIRFM